jgi:hypothetical protein
MRWHLMGRRERQQAQPSPRARLMSRPRVARAVAAASSVREEMNGGLGSAWAGAGVMFAGGASLTRMYNGTPMGWGAPIAGFDGPAPTGSPTMLWAASSEAPTAFAPDHSVDQVWNAAVDAWQSGEGGERPPRHSATRRRQVWREIDATMTTLRAR